MEDVESNEIARESRFESLQRKLKEERLFVRQEKETLRSLNESATIASDNLFRLSWKTRQHWLNLDRLAWGGRVSPAECSAVARLIDDVQFSDASQVLGYQEISYGEFLARLRSDASLVASILDYYDRTRTHTRHVTNLLISSLYSSCVLKEDENILLMVVKRLIEVQVHNCEDLVTYFCGKRATDTAFACVLTSMSEILFSAKLYLTAALHGSVMQVIVDDSTFLDVEASKVLSRIAPKAVLEKFGAPGTSDSKRRIAEHMKTLQDHIVRLCNKFLKSLLDKIYCFPSSLRWIIWQLYVGMIDNLKLPLMNAKAIIGHVLMSFFICPAIIKPEPYGINADADISEIARHNLGQIASVLRSLALLECGLKDEKLDQVMQCFEKGVLTRFVDAVLLGAEKVDLVNKSHSMSGLQKCAFYITEVELKTLIFCLKRFHRETKDDTCKYDLGELFGLLPPPPRKWSKTKSSTRQAKSMPPDSLALVDVLPSSPVPPPRQSRVKKFNSFTGTPREELEALSPEEEEQELEAIKEGLLGLIRENEPVLAIPTGAETDNQVGMLPEEKVLGISSGPPPTATFDLEQSDEDRRKRASSLMLAALSEKIYSEPREKPINEVDLRHLYFSSDSGDSSLEKLDSADVGETTSKHAALLMDLSSSNDPSPTPSEEHAPCLPLDDERISGDPYRELVVLSSGLPQLPLKRHQHAPVVSVLQDEPLINLDNEMFLDSRLDRTKTLPAFKRDNRISTVSLIGGSGGINDILQSARAPSPTSINGPTNGDPWSPEAISQLKTDPWGLSRESVVLEEEPVGHDADAFLNPFEDSFSAQPEPSFQPEVRYEDYLQTIKREQAKAALLAQARQDLSTIDEHPDASTKPLRKRSQGRTWLKDKISTSKLVSGLRQTRTKSELPVHLKKTGDAAQVPAPEPAPQSRIKAGTPMEASEVIAGKLPRQLPKGEVDDIMEKYRNISQVSARGNFEDTLLDMPVKNQLLTIPEGDIKFDEEFKFEDAKRKLRTVLCSSEAGSLPSDATSFDHLLLTMLQSKLAEAINLQDRSAVAQLHETLRSIKQLPRGSCEKLIVKLEDDYKLRSAYISYLIRSRQGLSATKSCLDELARKVERDRTICRQYFTTLAVRFFLETTEMKREVASFSHRFSATRMLDEKCDLLHQFLDKIHADMQKEGTWKYASDEQLESAKVATERAVMSRIYKEAFYPNGVTDIENDRIFHEHISRLGDVITLNHESLQIPKTFQKEAPWPSAQTELLMVNAYKTAVDKLRCIHRCCVTIMNLLSMASDKHDQGADDFMPVMVYVVIRANPPNLLSTKQYVNTFYESRLSGEEYYCWMQFCAAIEFIKTLQVRGS